MRSNKHLPLILIAVTLVLSLHQASAQSYANEVHVAPRVPAQNALSSLAKSAAGILRTSVDLVLVPVTVMDQSHRIITGLTQENFVLSEDKRRQPIKHFWKEDEPVSVGIVLDVSGSMDTKVERAREAVKTLLSASNPHDEFSLITFADRPKLIQPFTQNADELQSHLLFAMTKGRT